MTIGKPLISIVYNVLGPEWNLPDWTCVWAAGDELLIQMGIFLPGKTRYSQDWLKTTSKLRRNFSKSV